MNGKGKSLLGFLLVVFFFVSLTAFIEPVAVVLQKVTTKAASWRGLKVAATRTLIDPSTKEETMEQFFIELKKPDKYSLSVLTYRNGQKQLEKRKPSPMAETMLNLLLVMSKRDALYDALVSLGVDFDTRGLGRLNRHVCILFGALEGQEDKPQAWFGKFNAHLSRLVYFKAQAANSIRHEIRMLDWDSPSCGGLFPKEVVIRRDNQTIERWNILSVERI